MAKGKHKDAPQMPIDWAAEIAKREEEARKRTPAGKLVVVDLVGIPPEALKAERERVDVEALVRQHASLTREAKKRQSLAAMLDGKGQAEAAAKQHEQAAVIQAEADRVMRLIQNAT